MITTQELLDTAIGQLRILVAFLGEQLGSREAAAESETVDIRACHDMLAHLTLLILRLESASTGAHPSLYPSRPLQPFGH
jgi:hypothetical protein